MPKSRKPKIKNNNRNDHKNIIKTTKVYEDNQHNHEQFLHNKEKTSFELLIQGAMRCDPKLGLFLLSLMAGAGAIGLYTSMNWNDNNNSNNDNSNFTSNNSTSTKLPLDKPLVKQDPCKTAVFYERHHDAGPTRVVNSLWPLLVEHGYTTFLSEEPKGRAIADIILAIDNGAKRLDQHLQVLERFKTDPDYTRNKAEFNNAAEAFREYKKLLKTVQKEKLNYVAVDMDSVSREQLDDEARGTQNSFHINQRDRYMAESIHEACQRNKSGQVLIVGVDHVGIERILRKNGYNITSSYIIDTPELENDPNGFTDSMLRKKNKTYMEEFGYNNTHIINYYDDPEGAKINLAGFVQELWEGKADE